MIKLLKEPEYYYRVHYYDEYMKEFEQLAYYKLTVYENNEFLFTKIILFNDIIIL